MQRDVHSNQSLRGREGEAGGVRSVCLLMFLVSNSPEFFFTYLAGNTVRTQFSKTERWLNPAQHRDNVDVFYTTAASGGKTPQLMYDEDILKTEKKRNGREMSLTRPLDRSRTKLS